MFDICPTFNPLLAHINLIKPVSILVEIITGSCQDFGHIWNACIQNTDNKK